jgi:hypothetical protein
MSSPAYPAYPVHVDATLDSHLSRWLWLVKWLLAIPHYFVLAFLWAAFVVLSVFAFVAIVFTGRYPRSIFDFNVGVLRWSWRVAYYTYGALGTDRYPPFSLGEVPDYPAHLTVDYPEHLSRGLVWVKWWLLAIPHYLIVGILVGGTWFAWETTTSDSGTGWTSGGGLIGLLVFFAAIGLLFTGRYPQQIFDMVLGFNRWVLRVAAYAALMTDDYPPFRLDMGGQDPSPGRFAVPAGPPAGAAPAAYTAQTTQPTTQSPSQPPGTAERAAQPPSQPPAGQPPASGATTGGSPSGGGGITWGAGRVIAVVVAALVFLLAGGLLAGGTTLAVADQNLRDDDGYLMSPTETLSTGGFAIASEPLRIDTGASADWVPRSLLGKVRLEAQAPAGQDVFIGVARTSDAAAYLAGVRHATLVDFREVDGRATPMYRVSPGGAPEALPGDTNIAETWVASASGSGRQQLVWDPGAGDYTLVVMNADGTAGVSADMSAGATVPVLSGIVVGMLVAGGVLLIVSIALVLLALNVGRGASSTPSGTSAGSPPAGGQDAGTQ